MKEIFGAIVIVMGAIVCTSCELGINEKEENPLSQFQENPVSVT
jgi:hypothetical protein